MSSLLRIAAKHFAIGIAQGAAEGITRLGTIWAARKLDLSEENYEVIEVGEETPEPTEEAEEANGGR